MPKPLKIDGTTLEGGGQLVRLSICLATLTNRSVHIFDIRGRRPGGGGGLRNQHLTAVEWLGEFCGARVVGAKLRSREVLFEPGCNVSGPLYSLWSGRLMRDVATKQAKSRPWWTPTTLPSGAPARAVVIDLRKPGAVTLVLQAILPVLLFTPTGSAGEPYLVTLRGGTNVSFSPSVDYLEQVLFPNLALLGVGGLKVVPGSVRRGWSHGGSRVGEVGIEIVPLGYGEQLQALRVMRHGGAVRGIGVTVLASGVARGLLTNEVLQAGERFGWKEVMKVVTEEESGNQKRLYLLMVAEMEGGLRLGYDWLYDKKIGGTDQDVEMAVQEMAGTVASKLKEQIEGGAILDEWMEDQIVVFQALAKGRSCVEGVVGNVAHGVQIGIRIPSLHARTARWLAGELLKVDFDDEGACQGVGFVAGGESLSRIAAR